MSAGSVVAGPVAARDAEVTVAALRLHYREWGPADAPAVLLLHGLTGNAWEWEPVAAALAHRHRVVALDQRGHGGSAWASRYDIDLLADDVARFVELVGLAPVAVVGHSMGALLAIAHAARCPETVRRVVVLDLGPDSMSPAAAQAWLAWLERAAETSYAEPGEALVAWRAVNPRARERETLHYLRHNLAPDPDGRWRWRYDAVGLRRLVHDWPSMALQWAYLHGVRAPTLVVRGRESAVLSRGCAARMVRELPDAELVEFADAGHDLTVEQPEALARAVSRFLAGPARAG